MTFYFLFWCVQADLWSVGAILFQLVTGQPPFEGNNQLQVSGVENNLRLDMKLVFAILYFS